MHIEAIEFDLAEREITDARIGDDVFSGATVDWGGLMKADLHWVFEKLEEIVEAWRESDDEDDDEDVEGSGWLLVGKVKPEDTEQVDYSLHRDDAGWVEQVAFGDLTNDRQARVTNATLEIIDAVNGMLLIYE